MIDRDHPHPAGLEHNRRVLLVHLWGEHDLQELPSSTSLPDLVVAHQDAHHAPVAPAMGLFQTIEGPRPTPEAS